MAKFILLDILLVLVVFAILFVGVYSVTKLLEQRMKDKPKEEIEKKEKNGKSK